MDSARKAFQCLHLAQRLRFDEPMAAHTSFRVGGPADIYAVPESEDELLRLVRTAKDEQLPIFVLGGGANILVSDRGVRGLVVDMAGFSACSVEDSVVVAGAGAGISDVSEYAADRCLSGLEFIYAMPGSVGGSVWMNARCYEVSISERLAFVDLLDLETPDGYSVSRMHPDSSLFDYKCSPFQAMRCVILRAGFELSPGNATDIRSAMEEKRNDRERKGHFRAPSVGSIFKNNHDFGQPTGMIIDALGLRGHAVGGARIADYHANIIVNAGGATAADILRLVEIVEARVFAEKGYRLDREVLLVGEW